MSKKISHEIRKAMNKIYYAGLDKDTYHAIENRMVTRNIRNMRVISLAAAIYATVYILMVRLNVLPDELMPPYLYLDLIALIYYFMAPFFFKRTVTVKRHFYFLFLLLFFIFGEALGTIYTNNNAVTFNVLLFMMAFLPDTSRYTVPFIAVNVVIFNVMATFSHKAPDVLFNDRFNSLIFGLLAIYFNFRIARNAIIQVAAQQKAEREKNYDGLTGLLTKKGAESMVQELLVNHVSGYLIVLDIDHFKQVNDHHGHLYGDYIIQSVAELLKTSFRDDDVISRFGGDEFVVFVKSADRDIVRARMNDFYAKVHHQLDGITCSAGLASSHGSSYEELFECADEALYAVKNNGRNGFKTYEELKKES